MRKLGFKMLVRPTDHYINIISLYCQNWMNIDANAFSAQNMHERGHAYWGCSQRWLFWKIKQFQSHKSIVYGKN